MKILLALIPNKYRKWLYLLAAFAAVIITARVLFAPESSDTDSAKSATEKTLYEAKRAQRMIETIDQRKEAELNALKKETVRTDTVLDELDKLLSRGK